MSGIKSPAATAIMMLMLTATALAQFNSWPSPLPPAPVRGDYDHGHVWHDASWWWENQPDWVRANHPEWWGDYYQGVWYPAGWWWQYQPQWVRVNHPEWWGFIDNGVC